MTAQELGRLDQLGMRKILGEVLLEDEQAEYEALMEKLNIYYPMPERSLPESVIEANKEAEELLKIRIPKRRKSRPKLKE